jgi:hypothetical protein
MMHWVLVVIVAGMPVKTDLTFDSLGACLSKEAEMRNEWVEVINKTIEWSNKNVKTADERQKNIDFVMSQSVHGTCIPAK